MGRGVAGDQDRGVIYNMKVCGKSRETSQIYTYAYLKVKTKIPLTEYNDSQDRRAAFCVHQHQREARGTIHVST